MIITRSSAFLDPQQEKSFKVMFISVYVRLYVCDKFFRNIFFSFLWNARQWKKFWYRKKWEKRIFQKNSCVHKNEQKGQKIGPKESFLEFLWNFDITFGWILVMLCFPMETLYLGKYVLPVISQNNLIQSDCRILWI